MGACMNLSRQWSMWGRITVSLAQCGQLRSRVLRFQARQASAIRREIRDFKMSSQQTGRACSGSGGVGGWASGAWWVSGVLLLLAGVVEVNFELPDEFALAIYLTRYVHT